MIGALEGPYYDYWRRGRQGLNPYWTAIWHPDLVEAIKQQLAQEPVATKYSWPDEIRSSDRRSS